MAYGERCHIQSEIAKTLALYPAYLVPFADFVAILILPLYGSLLNQSTENLTRNLCFWSLLGLLTILLAMSHGGYRHADPKQIKPLAALIIRCFLATSLALLLLAFLLGHPHILTKLWTALYLAATPFLIYATRILIAFHLQEASAPSGRGTLIVCYDHCPRDLHTALNERKISPDIIGVLYLSGRHASDGWHNWPKLSDQSALLTLMRAKTVQDIIFVHHPALDGSVAEQNKTLLEELLVYPARIWAAFDLAQNLPGLLIKHASACKILPLATEELITSYNPIKRSFDILGATLLLLLAIPALLIIACLVRASGPGPIIFRQIRTGAHGRQFAVLKFRTMRHDPNGIFAQATPDDPRITRIGRLLRRFSLDELLQLVNVIRGDMSLVGPRPHAPETQVEGISFENALQLYRLRHRVKPGMTGLAQIRGQRGETRALSMLEQRLASDLEYIHSWSIWLDCLILFQTLPAILSQKNAW